MASPSPIFLERKVRLTPSEEVAWECIRRKMAVNLQVEFSADDLRDWNIVEMLPGERSKIIGILLFKLLQLDKIKKVRMIPSSEPSNHFRRIWVYEPKYP